MIFEDFYKKECIPKLMKDLALQNRMRVPRLEKVVVSSSVKEATQDAKVLDRVVMEMTEITGQKPVITRAKKSISNFKLRKGMPIGCCVVLRRQKMFEFVNRLINVTLPRTRDFHGVSPKGFDGRGNYTLGIQEQIVFPEIEYEKIERIWGMNVSFVTTARTDKEGMALLKVLGVPFREI